MNEIQKNLSAREKTRRIIANFSLKERIAFIIASFLVVVGVVGGLVSLSNRFTTIVPQYGGTYREGIMGSPRFINPVLAYSSADHDLETLIYSGLTRKSEDGSMVADLAESWEISPDGKTYTVTLKPDVSFHDRKPLTSADVIFTVSKIQDPVLKSPLRVAWDGVTVTAPDARTVVFTLQKPYAGFLNQLALGILPAHIWRDIPNESWITSVYNTEPIGSGPYKIKNVDRSRIGIPERYTLEAFKKFALGKPYIKEFVIVSFTDKIDAYDAFHGGNLDGLALVDSGDVEHVARRSTNVITRPLPRVFSMFLNPTKQSMFGESAVIKSIGLAIDTPTLVETIFKGYATNLAGPLPVSMDLGVDDYATRKALAIKLLDTAGWKLNPEIGLREKSIVSGTGTAKKTVKQTLTFSLATANTPELEQAAGLIANQLREIGINVEIKIFEIGTLHDQVIRERNFDALLFGQVIKHDTDIFAFWHSSQKIDPGLNITGYTNKTVDTLLESAIKEPDSMKRSVIYQKITAELQKNAPVVFLYAPDFISLMSPAVQNPVMPSITESEGRFALAHQWYMRTDRVWNIFIRD